MEAVFSFIPALCVAVDRLAVCCLGPFRLPYCTCAIYSERHSDKIQRGELEWRRDEPSVPQAVQKCHRKIEKKKEKSTLFSVPRSALQPMLSIVHCILFDLLIWCSREIGDLSHPRLASTLHALSIITYLAVVRSVLFCLYVCSVLS